VVKRTVPALVAASLLAGACAGSTSTVQGASSGIEGKVVLGPMCPVETQDSPCPAKPLAADVVVSTVDGEKVAGVRSGGDGRFRVSVPPGDYLITVEKLEGIQFVKPLPVTVQDGAFVDVTVSVDSGIR
jgi:Carboxypeptidase regulatory-like domain